jgi:membrane fusion protein
MDLFRSEVQTAQSAQWLGVVRMARPLGYTLVTAGALVSAALLIGFSVWGEVNRKTKITGLLVPVGGSLNISAPQAGVIADKPATEGQVVTAGEVLMIINTERQSSLDSAIGQTSALAAEQIELRKQSLNTEKTLRELQTRQREQVLADRLQTLDAQARQVTEEINLQRSRVALARKTVERYTQLTAEGFTPAVQLQGKEEELIDASSRLQALERTRLAVQQDRQTLSGERNSLATQLQSDTAQLARGQSTLAQEASENATRKSTVITAPVGTSGQRYKITALNLLAGQAVQAGQTLATLVPVQAGEGRAGEDITVEAQLFAPSRTAGFLKTGQPVYLRYSAYPYQKFGLHSGSITAVSSTPFAVNELPPNLAPQLAAQNTSNEALFRVTVKLAAQVVTTFGEVLPLKPGLTLEADVLQERRKIWEWVLEPLMAAKANLKILNSELKPNLGGGSSE